MPPPVYVLIGGRSTRFGVDKATHEIDGEPWALHVGRRLAAPDAEITLVGSLTDTETLAPFRRIDDAPGCEGPLAGVLAALEDRAEGPLTLASCDLVRPEAAWLEPLIAAHETDRSLDVAAYRTAAHWQPFPCVMNAGWATELRRLVENGVDSLQHALDASNAAALPWPGGEMGPAQANRVADLRARLGVDRS